MTTVALVRVSSDKQDTDRQVADITRWAMRSGETIDRWAEDKLSRDLSANRPEFQRLLADVEAGRVKLVVVAEFNRFGVANAREFFYFCERFVRAGCGLVSVAEGDLLREDIANQIQRFFQAGASEEEQKKKGTTSLDGKRHLFRAKAGPQGGPTPYGFDKACYDLEGRLLWRFRTTQQQPVRGVLTVYDAAGNPAVVRTVSGTEATPRRSKKCASDYTKLVPSEDDARVELVRDIFRAYTGPVPVSTRKVAMRLNSRGETNLGRPWCHTTIEALLKNEKYVGDYTAFKVSTGRFGESRNGRVEEVDKRMRDRLRYEAPQPGKKKRRIARPVADADRIKATGTHEGIVERAVWERAQGRLGERTTTVGRAVRSSDSPLRGLLICATCKQPMWAAKQEGHIRYECATYAAEYRMHGEGKTCGRNLVHHDAMMRVIRDKVDECGRLLKPDEPEASLAALYLANLPEDYDRIPDDLLDNGVSWAGLIDEQREAREAELAALERQRAKWYRAKAMADTDEERAFAVAELKALEGAIRKAKEAVKPGRVVDDSAMVLLAMLAAEQSEEEMDVVGVAREMFAFVEVAVEEKPYGIRGGKPRSRYELRPEGCRFTLKTELASIGSQIVHSLLDARARLQPV